MSLKTTSVFELRVWALARGAAARRAARRPRGRDVTGVGPLPARPHARTFGDAGVRARGAAPARRPARRRVGARRAPHAAYTGPGPRRVGGGPRRVGGSWPVRWPLQGRAAARSSNDVRSYGARDGVPVSDVRTSGELSPPGASRVSAQRFESGASVPARPLPPGPALRTTVVRRGLPTHTCNVIRVRGDDLRSEPHAATAQGPTASHAARRRRNAPPPRTYRAAGAPGKPRRHFVLFYAAINAMQLSVCGLSAVICIVVSTIELVACATTPRGTCSSCTLLTHQLLRTLYTG